MSEGIKYFNPDASEAFNSVLRGIYPELLAQTTVSDRQLIGIKQSGINSYSDPTLIRSADFGLFSRQGKSLVAVSLLPPHTRDPRAKEDIALGFVAFRQINDVTGKIESVHEITDAYIRSASEELDVDIDLQDQGQMVTLLHFGLKKMSAASFFQLRTLPKAKESHKKRFLETAINLGLANRLKKQIGPDLYLASYPIDRDTFIEILEDRYPFLADSAPLGVRRDDESGASVPVDASAEPLPDNLVDFNLYKKRREARKASKTPSQT